MPTEWFLLFAVVAVPCGVGLIVVAVYDAIEAWWRG